MNFEIKYLFIIQYSILKIFYWIFNSFFNNNNNNNCNIEYWIMNKYFIEYWINFPVIIIIIIIIILLNFEIKYLLNIEYWNYCYYYYYWKFIQYSIKFFIEFRNKIKMSLRL